MARRPSYEYVMLAEAAERQGWANLYAIVVECSVPRPTKGTDMVSNLRLVDPSTATNPQFPDGMEMLAFSAQQHHLPTLHHVGDIIRLHRVTVTQYNGKPQLIAKIHKAKECSFCLFGGSQEADNSPYQVSSELFTLEDRDPGIISALRSFGKLLNSTNLSGSTAYLRHIKDIRPGVFFDIVCRVLALDQRHPECQVMYVWDGTDALPLPYMLDQNEISIKSDTPDNIQRDPAWEAAQRHAMPVRGNGVLADLPLLGTAMPIIIYSPHQPSDSSLKPKLVLPSIGSWVKLRNVKAWVKGGQLQGRYLANSKWAPCEPDEQALAEDAERSRINNVAGWAPGDPQQWLTGTHHSHPFTTLRALQINAGTGQTQKNRCLVNVLRYAPADVQHFCHPAASLKLSGPEPSDDKWVYMVKLHLQDATGEIDVGLFDKDAETFFENIPAQDLRPHSDQAEVSTACQALQQQMNELIGLHCSRDGGCWIECCVKTYYTDRKNPEETCLFRIFDTKLR